MRRRTPSRRRVLAAVGVVAGSIAGCTGSDGDGSDATDATEPTAAGSATDPAAADAPDLDLREANVVGVAIDRDGDGRAYDFAVTLRHDDDGEDGYANWWQVERLDGERLGRRELRHAHSRQPFTRSATVEIPAAVECVVVRGHDETHGYGGRLAVVDLGSGATNAVDQGAERQPVDAGDCPSA